MKTIKMFCILALLCPLVSYAQSSKNSFEQLSLDDISDALKTLKIEIFNFNIPVDSNKKYQLILHSDEYAKDTLISHQEIGLNEMIGKGTRELSGTRLSFMLQKRSDSVYVIKSKTGGGERMAMLKKSSKYNIEHVTKLFKTQDIVPGKKLPLLLLGSMWHDPNIPANMVRFCMERLLDTDFRSEAFKNMPHHYLISVELVEN